MLKLNDIKVLHIESTDVCQAACPLCARETDSEFCKDQPHHLDMNKIMQVFDTDCISKLNKMFMCGNYGDPAAGKHTLNIYKEFRRLNSNIVLGMNTNGGIQNTIWWHELGTIFNQPQDYVVFSIDGLEDTNAIYRRGVDWRKVMNNARAFIDAGGSAHWDMLVYRHNQHQVDQCQALAKSMGFRWFRAKVSKRPLLNGLELPTTWQKTSEPQGQIQCHALSERSVYIDAQGRKHPCCWLGSRQSNFITDIGTVASGWNTDQCNPVCKSTCTNNSTGSNFTNQWHKEIQIS